MLVLQPEILKVPGALQLSVVGVLSAVALSLPTAVLASGAGEQAPLSGADVLSLSLFGGWLAWFSCAAVSYGVTGPVPGGISPRRSTRTYATGAQ